MKMKKQVIQKHLYLSTQYTASQSRTHLYSYVLQPSHPCRYKVFSLLPNFRTGSGTHIHVLSYPKGTGGTFSGTNTAGPYS